MDVIFVAIIYCIPKLLISDDDLKRRSDLQLSILAFSSSLSSHSSCRFNANGTIRRTSNNLDNH